MLIYAYVLHVHTSVKIPHTQIGSAPLPSLPFPPIYKLSLIWVYRKFETFIESRNQKIKL